MRTSPRHLLSLAAITVAACALACSPPAAPEKPAEAAPAPVPAGPEVRQVASFDGLPIAYEVRGAGETAVVFVHCWSCDRSFWDGAAAALADRYRVVAIDLGGHGASGTEGRSEWSVPVLARDVVAVADDLGLQRMILVGHSMGGPTSLVAAESLPGRVLGVIGVDTLQDADFEWNPESFEQLKANMKADFPAACGQMIAGMFPATADPAVVESTRARMCDANPLVATALIEGYPALDMPALFRDAGVPIRGINAAFIPTSAENNRKYAPDFDFVVMEGVGHFPMFEAPEAFEGHLARFVDELAAK